jgi:transcriptional regulator with XRE-family HTH domain
VVSRSHRQPEGDSNVTAEAAAGIGTRIRQLRGSATQLEFARRLGIAREHLSRLESGTRVPGGGTLRRLAEVTQASLDFVLLGGASPAPRASAPEAGGFTAALEPLLGATSLRLPRVSTAAARRADRAWQDLSGARQDEIRAFVRRVALIAVALEALLPAKAAGAVNDELSEVLATLLVDRILTARSGPVS